MIHNILSEFNDSLCANVIDVVAFQNYSYHLSVHFEIIEKKILLFLKTFDEFENNSYNHL